MKIEIVKIDIYDKRDNKTTTVAVEKLGENVFKLVEYVGGTFRASEGDVFKVRLNRDGKYEIANVLKGDNYIKHPLLLSSAYNGAQFRAATEEVLKQGGYVDVKFEHLIEVVLPRTSQLDVNAVFGVEHP